MIAVSLLSAGLMILAVAIASVSVTYGRLLREQSWEITQVWATVAKIREQQARRDVLVDGLLKALKATGGADPHAGGTAPDTNNPPERREA